MITGYNKRRLCYFIIFLTYLSNVVVSIKVESATYEIKDTNLEGIQERHAIFTVHTDEEIYYYNDPVCGCMKNMSMCSSKYSLNLPINESGYNITLINKNQWYSFDWINFEETRYFKFYLGPENVTNCPILKLEHNLNIGDANMVVSNRYIPTHTEYQWIKYRWFRDALWICPSNYEWAYGWWYLAIFPDTPRVEHISYRLRWSTKDINTCNIPPPTLASPSNLDDWILLEDDIPYEGWFEPRKFYWFRFYVNATCTDFGISARPLTPYSKDYLADFDLFVSVSDMYFSTRVK